MLLALGSGGGTGSGAGRRTTPEVNGTFAPREAKIENMPSETSVDSWQAPALMETGVAGAGSTGPIEP